MEFNIKDALHYPLRNFKSFWNFLWMLVPIYGWFFFNGYVLQILENVTKGRDSKLPVSHVFWNEFMEGAKWFACFIPLWIVLIISTELLPLFGLAVVGWIIYTLLVIPMYILMTKYSLERKFSSLYRYDVGYSIIFKNFLQFLLLIIYIIVISIIWLIVPAVLIAIAFFVSNNPVALILLILLIIIVSLVCLPALTYSSYYLVAKYYSLATSSRRAVKSRVVVKKTVKKKKAKKKRK